MKFLRKGFTMYSFFSTFAARNAYISNTMNRYFLIALFALASMGLQAQQTATVTGRVVDATNGQPTEWAEVFVTDLNDHVLASGIVSDGTFRLTTVPAARDILLMVRMLGYEPYISKKLTCTAGKTTDMGTLRLAPLAVGLEEVTVQGERNRIVYKLDRQVISGAAAVTAAGGTAADILAGTPSIQTDAEGGITFRGSSGFQVYVDGKLSPLEGAAALQQIPAGQVEDIEIITTPSARYRTDGDAGIINITTKRSKTDGLSGIVHTSAGTLGTWSGDGQLEFRKGYHSWYLGGTAQQIKGRSDFRQDKTTTVDDITTTSASDGQRWRRNGTTTARGGWQFADGQHHNLSIDLLYGTTDNWRGGDMTYDETRYSSTGDQHSVFDSHDRYNLGKHLAQASLTYIWKINPAHELSLTNRCRYDSYSIEYTESNMFTPDGKRYEGTRGYEEEHHWDADGALTWKWKYRPTGTLETGYQYTTYSEHGGYRINYWDRGAEAFEWQDDLATPFYYRRQVHSLYSMLNDQVGAFSFEGGLRADRVIDGLDIEIADASRHPKRLDIFPSAHVSYDAPGAGPITLGYSYRTNRPGIWNLEPYITYEDYYTKKIGNPDIRPEFIHSAELSWHKAFNDNTSLSAAAYYRYRKDITDWVRRPYEPGVTLDSIVNAGNQAEYGLEMSGVVKPVSWWNTMLGGSAFYYDFNSTCPVCDDRAGIFWQVNWNNTFHLASHTNAQLDTHVVGPKILTQGYEKAYFYCDFAVRQQLLKERLTLAFVAHDVFHTARYYNIRETEGLTSITQVRPSYPNFLLSLSYSFNTTIKKPVDVSNDTPLFEGKEF